MLGVLGYVGAANLSKNRYGACSMPQVPRKCNTQGVIITSSFRKRLLYIYLLCRAYDLANLSGCHQWVDKPTNNLGNNLDLFLTDVPGIVDATVSQPVGTSDHNSILVNITMLIFQGHITLTLTINWDLIESKLDLVN